MGFIKNFKRDFAQAVNELLPESDEKPKKNKKEQLPEEPVLPEEPGTPEEPEKSPVKNADVHEAVSEAILKEEAEKLRQEIRQNTDQRVEQMNEELDEEIDRLPDTEDAEDTEEVGEAEDSEDSEASVEETASEASAEVITDANSEANVDITPSARTETWTVTIEPEFVLTDADRTAHRVAPVKEAINDKGERIYFGSGKSQPKWYSDGFTKTKTPEERQKWRSKTFPGVARAIAEQWTIQIAAEENLLDEKEWEILGRDYLELLDKMTGGIRYTDVTVDKELEKKKYPVHFNQELLNEVEKREQTLIEYWKPK